MEKKKKVVSDVRGDDKVKEDFRAMKLLFDTVIIDTCYYTFVQTHRMYHTKREPWGFPGGSDSKKLLAMQETQVQPLGQEDPLGREWQPTPIFLPGKSHGLRSLKGYSPWGHKEKDMTERLTLSLSRVNPNVNFGL